MFFAGLGHPGEPDTPEEMKRQLMARVMPLLTNDITHVNCSIIDGGLRWAGVISPAWVGVSYQLRGVTPTGVGDDVRS